MITKPFTTLFAAEFQEVALERLFERLPHSRTSAENMGLIVLFGPKIFSPNGCG